MREDALLCLWGKTDRREPARYHPLLFHMLDVAAVCDRLSPRFSRLIPVPREWLRYIVALHDVGKADPLFQNRIPKLANGLRQAGLSLPFATEAYRHEARSAEWLLDHLTAEHGWQRRAANVVCQAVHGHHGNFQAEAAPDENTQRHAEWQQLRTSLAAIVADVLQLSPWATSQFTHASQTGVTLSGLVVLSDWIASNEQLFRYLCLPRDAEPSDYYNAALQEAAEALRRLRFDPVPSSGTGISALPFRAVWPGLAELRPAQRKLEELCTQGVLPGLAIIEAPTGDGKTEAAIYLAEHWRQGGEWAGTYIALPTAATSNQMHERYAAFLRGRHPDVLAPRLVHGMAWLLDDASPTATSNICGEDTGESQEESNLSREWFRNAKRALLAPEAVGTVDQALMAALNVKHGFLRLLGLSAKVLIVDEVHAYDEYMSTILRRLLEWCRALEVPVILLSATLSSAQKRLLAEAYGGTGAVPTVQEEGCEAYPLLTFVPLNGTVYAAPVPDARRRSIELQCHAGFLGDPDRTAALAVEQVRAGGCACAVANTVADAQAIYRSLRLLDVPDTELYLFHARFPAARRQELEGMVTGLFGKDAGKPGFPPRPERAILVATQVVEQSLDLDFDVMLSQLAPIDLLLQRSGRLHRHARDNRPTGPQPVLHVLHPTRGDFYLGRTEYVYHRYPLLRTMALLHDRSCFDLPTDFRRLVEGCYGNAPLPAGVVPDALLAEAAEERQVTLAQARSKAHEHLIPIPSPSVFRLAQAQRPVSEADEGATADYFHAQTRLGGDRTRALVLHDPALLTIALDCDPPDRETLRRLFLQMVDLPAWWLQDLSDGDGAEALPRAPNWLDSCAVIPMHGRTWRGRDSKGRTVILRDDPELGMLRVTDESGAPEGVVDADF